MLNKRQFGFYCNYKISIKNDWCVSSTIGKRSLHFLSCFNGENSPLMAALEVR